MGFWSTVFLGGGAALFWTAIIGFLQSDIVNPITIMCASAILLGMSRVSYKRAGGEVGDEKDVHQRNT